jgi:hypothetical protein
LVGIYLGKLAIGRSRKRWEEEGRSKLDRREICCEDVN